MLDILQYMRTLVHKNYDKGQVRFGKAYREQTEGASLQWSKKIGYHLLVDMLKIIVSVFGLSRYRDSVC